MVTRFLLFLVFVSCSILLPAKILAAQNRSVIDSLEKVLLTTGDDTNRLNTLNLLCKQFRNAEDYNKAMGYARQAKALAEKLLPASLSAAGKKSSLKGLVIACNHIGEISRTLGNYAEAMENYLHTLRINEEMGNEKGRAVAYNNIGIIYVYQGNYLEALRNYRQALEIRKKINDKSGIASTYNNMGAVFSACKDYSNALENYMNALRLFEQLGDKQGLSRIYNNLGVVYERIGTSWYKNDETKRNENYTYALRNYNHSLEIKRELNDRQGIAASCINIGAIYSLQKNFSDAQKYLDEALALSQKIGFKEGLREGYDEFSKLMAAENNFKEAYRYHLLFMAMKDSLVNEESTKKITQLQLQYQQAKIDSMRAAEQRAKELQARSEVEKQKMMFNAAIAVLLCVILLAFFIYRGYRQKQRANEIIEAQKLLVEEKNKDITDSINYAKRIQEAILPLKEFMGELFPDAFTLFYPRDIVSGDFYWFTEKKGKKLIAAVDCTGHGVPGAFMSMIGNAFLNEIVNERGIINPGEILGELRHNIIRSLKQSGAEGEQKDGMDISLLSIEGMEAEWAGANNPLWLLRNGKCMEFNPDKRPVGYFRGKGLPFTSHKIKLQRGDSLYIFTDGYADQFGGPKGKKFKYRQLMELLLSIQDQSMAAQEKILAETFISWKGDLEQVDDVLLIGIRIS